MSTDRVIVQRGVSDALISELTALASKIRTGPNGSGSQIAGVFSDASAARIVSMLKDAQNDGAKVLVGDLKSDGSYVQPHVLLGYRPGMRAWEQEHFGPGTSGNQFGFDVSPPASSIISIWHHRRGYRGRGYRLGE